MRRDLSLAVDESAFRIIDVSAQLDGKGPYWPGSCGVQVRATSHVDRGDAVTNSTLFMDVHAGTHVDAPAHHLVGGVTADRLALHDMVGVAFVAELDDEVDAITSEVVDTLFGDQLPSRLLFKTRNSGAWSRPGRVFDPAFVGLTLSGALRLAAGGVRLVGIDYLSVQRFGETDECHQALFKAGTVVLEGLDLRKASAGWYRIVCLPLLLVGAEAAPARVILIEENS